MKKLFLLFAASSIGLSAWAQQNSNALITAPKWDAPDMSHNIVAHPELLFPKLAHKSHDAAAHKTSTLHPTNFSEWFDYWAANGQSSSTLYYFSV